MYQFNYMNKWLDFKLMGDYHTSEIYFVFDNPWPPIVHHFSRDDKDMVGVMQGFWGNFAKSGNPNGEVRLRGAKQRAEKAHYQPSPPTKY